jgi:hypothetical protein
MGTSSHSGRMGGSEPVPESALCPWPPHPPPPPPSCLRANHIARVRLGCAWLRQWAREVQWLLRVERIRAGSPRHRAGAAALALSLLAAAAAFAWQLPADRPALQLPLLAGGRWQPSNPRHGC